MEKPNRQIIQEMREMLTDWFKVDGIYGIPEKDLLDATKPWRGHMWRLINEAEARMCPVDYRDKLLKKEVKSES